MYFDTLTFHFQVQYKCEHLDVFTFLHADLNAAAGQACYAALYELVRQV